jgi:hypothetical protein
MVFVIIKKKSTNTLELPQGCVQFNEKKIFFPRKFHGLTLRSMYKTLVCNRIIAFASMTFNDPFTQTDNHTPKFRHY